MWDTMKLYLVGDGSLVICKYYKDGTPRKTTLIPPDQFKVDKLTGYLAKLSGKEVFDLVTTEDFLCPNNLSLDSLSLHGCESDLKQNRTTD